MRNEGRGADHARVMLRRDLSRDLRAGHPWLYREALTIPPGLPTGTVVEVCNPAGRFVARGLYDAGSPLAVRVYTLDPAEAIDRALFHRRLTSAWQSRQPLHDPLRTNALRWCNGEGDCLPGVVIDRYGPVAVLRLDGDAVRVLRAPLIEAIREVGGPTGLTHLVERSRQARAELLFGGPPPDPVEILEHGLSFGVDVRQGQKTGFFLDQRENRQAIRPYAHRARVANLFCYTGGFSVAAAMAGATRVDSVDAAAPAVAAARDNFRRNGLDPDAHGFETADVFDWLDPSRQQHHRYDLIIVDPPSFAPNEAALRKAVGAYKDLFARALALVELGGMLAAASCSSHLSSDRFLDILQEAGRRAHRPLRLLELRGQPADHPTPPVFREGRYLKFALLRCD